READPTRRLRTCPSVDFVHRPSQSRWEAHGGPHLLPPQGVLCCRHCGRGSRRLRFAGAGVVADQPRVCPLLVLGPAATSPEAPATLFSAAATRMWKALTRAASVEPETTSPYARSASRPHASAACQTSRSAGGWSSSMLLSVASSPLWV